MDPLNKIKVGIFFGGSSREREISFAGGRTVYDNLDKTIFEPIPIFVDSNHKMVILNWKYIYKGTIRDFYPPAEYTQKISSDFQIYIESLQDLNDRDYLQILSKIGRSIRIDDLPQLMDVAFLALHGSAGEDGQIQGLLEYIKIPYTGSGIFPSAVGIDKGLQKKWMKLAGFDLPKSYTITKIEWHKNVAECYKKADQEIGFPLVIRPAHQGSSIGVSILNDCDATQFEKAINAAFFYEVIQAQTWNDLSKEQKHQKVHQISDIRDGMGYPLYINDHVIYDPITLWSSLDDLLSINAEVIIKAQQSDDEVLIESFINGKEFSCIVMRKEDGTLTALPPTEIIKGKEVYDYRSKYLPGLSRKLTPINIESKDIKNIQNECKRLMEVFQFDAYARIDGFILEDGTIYLNDPNTTSGMLPSSFFFHQAAELGLNPSQFLSYILRISLYERNRKGNYGFKLQNLIERFDKLLVKKNDGEKSKKRIAVIFGGYSSERHISVESGRNIYEKLASSDRYEAIPYFLLGDKDKFELYKIPINLVLKDSADDIRDKILDYKVHPIVKELKIENQDILQKFVGSSQIEDPQFTTIEELSKQVDAAFIALHGRPGEDGSIQQKLDEYEIPYNGSSPDSASITIDKFKTLQLLKDHGFEVTNQMLVSKTDYLNSSASIISVIEKDFSYPFIIKPVDDGCSSAVQIIKDQNQLRNYLIGIFRENEENAGWRSELKLKHNEEFPVKQEVLVETLISDNGAKQFMEITGGLLTSYKNGHLEYELFEPSEALASGDILSLEEKFLAGEGQNITPARFGWDEDSYEKIVSQVKEDFEKAAKILGVTGYARIDAFVRIYNENKVETIIIEINSLPGMTPATCIFHQCALNGYKPFDFINEILTFAEERKINKLVQP